MNYKEFSDTLHRQVSSMPTKKALELVIDINKKLFFDYQNFSETYKWGEPDLLLDGISVCKKALTQYPDTSIVKELIQKIEALIPDTEDFGSELGSYALNASSSVCEALDYLLDNDNSHIMAILTDYTDTIETKINEKDGLGGQDTDDHPLMIQARQFLLSATK